MARNPEHTRGASRRGHAVNNVPSGRPFAAEKKKNLTSTDPNRDKGYFEEEDTMEEEAWEHRR
jgi:hypothetical protein